MPYEATVYRIFIASPNDVKKEREQAKREIHIWNSVNSFKERAVLIPVEMKDVAPQVGNPQDLIDTKAVKESEILVGIFWARLGSRTKKAKSGTVQEINLAIERGVRVMLYFSSADISQKSYKEEQYRGVQNIKKFYKKKCLLREYSTVDEFSGQFSEDIARTIYELHSEKAISNSKTTSNWIEAYKEKHGQLPVLPDYLLPMLTKGRSPGKPISKELKLIPVGAQTWGKFLPSQQEELLVLADWLGIGRNNYMNQSKKGWPAQFTPKKIRWRDARNGKMI